jgi:c-di-GMP-binding flagellar brake protein YcgR
LEIDLETNVLQPSPGGMMVEVGMPVDVGSEYAFTLNIDGEDLDLVGVARNVEPSTPGDPTTSYRIGIQFRDVSERQQAILTRFVESKL